MPLPEPPLRITGVTLGAPAGLTAELATFYGDTLGLPTSRPADERVAVTVGETVLELVEGEGAPFHHVALLVPGDRFTEARAWAAERVALLPEVETGEDVFDFTGWSALALLLPRPGGQHRRADRARRHRRDRGRRQLRGDRAGRGLGGRSRR